MEEVRRSSLREWTEGGFKVPTCYAFSICVVTHFLDCHTSLSYVGGVGQAVEKRCLWSSEEPGVGVDTCLWVP